MDLGEYFGKAEGTGVLATADDQGRVNLAIYAKPHIMDDETIAFIMADRLTHHNLQSNDHAAYLFLEKGQGYKGLRLFLTNVREEQDSELLYSLRSKRYASEKEEGKPRFLVFFKIDKVLQLIGTNKDVDPMIP